MQPPNTANRREISYIVKNPGTNEDFVIRNLSYSDWQSFRKDTIYRVPVRIDIGPVYDNDAKNNRMAEKKADVMSREYIIDIDMNDYDSIRTCCSSKTVCESCWNFLVAGQEVLERMLKKSFGFKHILWVFSGRRGIHAWVCDRRAQELDNKHRKAVTEYLNFASTNEHASNLVKSQLLSIPYSQPFEFPNQRGLQHFEQISAFSFPHATIFGRQEEI